MAQAVTAGAIPQNASADASVADRIDPRRLITFLCMVFGMFMAILDIQIVSASLTEIQAGLAASSDEISWVQTAYLTAEVVAIPLSGFLSRALGTRALFAISAAGFTAASLMCGLSATLAPTIGPTIGGYLTDALSWHWLFFINVVPGIAVTIATLWLVDFDKPDLKLLE